MGKSKIDKTDKKYLITALLTGFVLQFFIENGMDIALLGLFMYLNHKYISTTENIKEYDYYNFKDKDKFNKGKRKFSYLVDVYIVIRIFSMLIKPQDSNVFAEILLIVMMFIPYEKYLTKKYV